MLYRLLADFVVLLHFGFVLFVVLGGLLVLRWPLLAWLHLPAVAWGVAVEFGGWFCPLTYLEVWLRGDVHRVGTDTDFISRFLLPILYPPELTRTVQICLGLGALAINSATYWRVWGRRTETPPTPSR